MSRSPTETKSRILLSARNLFSCYGFTGTSMDDILDSTGITKGAFYHYFDSKEHLCQQVLQDVITEYHQLYETIDPTLSALEQLHQWLTILLEKNLSGQWLNCRLIGRLSVQPQQLGPQIQDIVSDFWQWYEGIYENWLSQCGLTEQDAGLSARTLVRVITGSLLLEKSSSDAYTTADIVQQQLKLILHTQ